MMNRMLRLLAGLTIAMVFWLANPCAGQESRKVETQPGLMATYQALDNQLKAISEPAKRIDNAILFDWGHGAPDSRIAAKCYSVHWDGQLVLRFAEKVRFRFYALGSVKLQIDGKTWIDQSPQPENLKLQWFDSQLIELESGSHQIALDYRKTNPDAVGRVGLYWESDSFALEPVNPTLFQSQVSNADWHRFERGHELAQRLRCDQCHGSDPSSHWAPSLKALRDRIDPNWLVAWIQSPKSLRSHANMPDFGLSQNEALAIASALWSEKPPALAKFTPLSMSVTPEVEGEKLFRSKGCLACHSEDLSIGGKLDQIGSKRPKTFFVEWLRDPKKLNPNHRMPIFELKGDELTYLAEYLAHNQSQKQLASVSLSSDKTIIEQGRSLIRNHRCNACHQANDDKASRVEKSAEPSPNRMGCVGEPDSKRHQPGYRLDNQAVGDLVAYYRQDSSAKLSLYEQGKRLIQERQCLNCHSRYGRGGLGTLIAANNPNATPDQMKLLLGETEPPSLTSVGDKLEDAALLQIIKGQAPVRRSWLSTRMPKFPLSDEEAKAIQTYLIGHDRIPDSDAPKAVSDLATTHKKILETGQILVSSRGFGCISCHAIKGRSPKETAPGARGPELTDMKGRIRPTWLSRWLRDPARIDPGTEMPALTQGLPGLLGGDRVKQIELMRRALESSDFRPLSDKAWSEQLLTLKRGDRAVILRDAMADAPPKSEICARTFAIGLENQVNLLFDLDEMTFRHWWTGDFALERAIAKSWVWEPGGPGLAVSGQHAPLLVLKTADGVWLQPEQRGQTRGVLLSYGYKNLCVFLDYRLYFPKQRSITIHEEIEPIRRDQQSGFRRRIEIVNKNDLQDQSAAIWVTSSPTDQLNGKELIQNGPLGPVRHFSQAAWQTVTHEQVVWRTTSSLEIESLAPSAPEISSPSLPLPPPPLVVNKVERFLIAPGWEAVRLPLDRQVMPISIGFRRDGTAVIGSLKGQLHQLLDRDGDGWEDLAQPFSDPLAAPFGITGALENNDVLASHKPEVLRLRDLDGDGRADRYEVVATGWGYSDDYHDWTSGLVRDHQGRLVVTLGSDYAQRDRKPSTHLWRGSALRIDPQKPVLENVEVIGRGLRFSVAVAMNRAGDMFCTDNQGDRNPFNEVNHLKPGHRHGVSAKFDPPDASDSFPLLATAVRIPHPWTRSVNGIAFLTQGEYQDQGIGSDYDRRGLVRFSLQKIGDDYQGVVYPMTQFQDGGNIDSIPQIQRLLGPIATAVSPKGDLYIGSIRDSGWGGGNNVGEVLRIRRSGALPQGIRLVESVKDGFRIEFNQAVDPLIAQNPDRYGISSYQRIWQGGYATPDRDRRDEAIQSVQVSDDRRSVIIKLNPLRIGFVYEIQLRKWGQGPLWPSAAYATINKFAP